MTRRQILALPFIGPLAKAVGMKGGEPYLGYGPGDHLAVELTGTLSSPAMPPWVKLQNSLLLGDVKGWSAAKAEYGGWPPVWAQSITDEMVASNIGHYTREQVWGGDEQAHR